MAFFLFFIIFLFILWLFNVFRLSRNDFLLIRKDIKLESIFNMAFLAGLSSLFFARLFFALFNPSPDFLNPLHFLAIPYFPGLSIQGAVIGAAGFLYVYARGKKLSLGRVLDIFSSSFILFIPVGYAGYFLLEGTILDPWSWVVIGFYAILALIFRIVFYSKIIIGKTREAISSLVFLIIFFAFNFLYLTGQRILSGSFPFNQGNIAALFFLALFIIIYFLRLDLLSSGKK